MSDQKIIQFRTCNYSDFVPSKLKPGEIVIIQSGDPESSSGKAIYACMSAGNVERMATQDELGSYNQSAQTAAEHAEQMKSDVATIKKQMDDELSEIRETVRKIKELKSEIVNLKEQVIDLVKSAETSADTAKTATEIIKSTETEIKESHTVETGDASTDGSGNIAIYLSDAFKDALKTNDRYRVFLQENGNGKVYVSGKTDTFFVVSGTENLAFSWTAVIEEKEEMNGRTGI